MKIQYLIKSRFNLPSIFLLLASLTALLFSHSSYAGNVTLAWDASASPGVAGYVISYGTATNTYSTHVDAGPVTSYQLKDLPDGAKLYFGVKAYSAGHAAESGYSNEVSAVVPAASATVTVGFTTAQTASASSLSVGFSGTADAPVTSWSWNFGDNTTGSGAQTTHIYNAAGSYPVALTAAGAFGSVTAQKTITVTAPATPPVANFTTNGSTATQASGVAPFSVNFADTSTGSVSSRVWNFGDGATSTLANPSHSYAAGSYTASLTVTGAGVSSTKNVGVTVSPAYGGGSTTVTNVASYLVAAYGFEEVGGALVVDASGKINHATANGPVRSAGRYGRGLTFDGVNDFVVANDSASLDLSAGYTLEAWVNPSVIKSGNVLTKEQAGGAVYGLYAHEDADLPIAAFNDGAGYRVTTGVSQLPLNTWSHLAATYDQQNLRLFVNGVQVAVKPYNGLIQQSNGLLRIGGNSVWGEYFKGIIDEVRIYNRALTAKEIQTDLKTAVVTAKPPQLIVGNKVMEPSVDSNPQGMAEAFKTTPVKTGVISSVNVYLDLSSTAKEIIAGVYSDNQGHPGKLLTLGKLTTPRAGATNVVAVPAIWVSTTKSYWLAILNAKEGVIKFRSRMGGGASPMETSASSVLTGLPALWTTGQVYPDGPMSVYSNGYYQGM